MWSARRRASGGQYVAQRRARSSRIGFGPAVPDGLQLASNRGCLGGPDFVAIWPPRRAAFLAELRTGAQARPDRGHLAIMRLHPGRRSARLPAELGTWRAGSEQQKRRGPSPLHFQSIATVGACRKTRVMPHNRRLWTQNLRKWGDGKCVCVVNVRVTRRSRADGGIRGALRALGAEGVVCAPPDFADLAGPRSACRWCRPASRCASWAPGVHLQGATSAADRAGRAGDRGQADSVAGAVRAQGPPRLTRDRLGRPRPGRRQDDCLAVGG